MMDDTIEQMRQEMTSIDKKVEIIEAEIKVIESDPNYRSDKSKFDVYLSKLNEFAELYPRSTKLRKEIFKMKNHNCMIDDTIEQMRQEMTSIDKKIEMLESEIKVIKSDPNYRSDKSKFDVYLSKLNEFAELYPRSTKLRKEIFNMKNSTANHNLNAHPVVKKESVFSFFNRIFRRNQFSYSKKNE